MKKMYFRIEKHPPFFFFCILTHQPSHQRMILLNKRVEGEKSAEMMTFVINWTSSECSVFLLLLYSTDTIDVHTHTHTHEGNTFSARRYVNAIVNKALITVLLQPYN
ncbi:hypothetical protein QTP70_018484 [Hemibagrus guttatus]|uniref:Uncharacterized protein n=1 Tax=Hemibagrus guttatus TaxID=175788 RepID=A0AAE0UYG2_9TELE|nr:hypothetical protein QTP70_018484 [Hemibagrus guttatus]